MKRNLLQVTGVVTAVVLSLGIYRTFESYPLSELKWRGGHVEYLKSENVTISVWSTSKTAHSGQLLLVVERGDTTNRNDAFFVSTMRAELSRVNRAELAILVSCAMDARSSKVSILDNKLMVSDGSWQLLVENGYTSAKCDKASS